jgi:cytochrome P450
MVIGLTIVITAFRLRFFLSSLLGPNVVASNGEVWKRHRRVTAPAFTQSAYQNVWKVTEGVYLDINQKGGWIGREVIADANRLTHKVRP